MKILSEVAIDRPSSNSEMRSSDYIPAIVFGIIGIGAGHAMACLPIAILKAYEVGKVCDWFKAWQLFVFVLGLPSLIVIEIPSALVIYVICFTVKAHRISTCVHRLHVTTLIISAFVAIVSALSSGSPIWGAISGISAATYFVCIIATARYCAQNITR